MTPVTLGPAHRSPLVRCDNLDDLRAGGELVANTDSLVSAIRTLRKQLGERPGLGILLSRELTKTLSEPIEGLGELDEGRVRSAVACLLGTGLSPQEVIHDSDPLTPRRDRDRAERVGHVDAVGNDAAGCGYPHHAGPFTMVKPDSTLLLERGVDLLEQILDLTLAAFDGNRAGRSGHKHRDLGHDSSSPLSEGAATPDDDSVEREASAAPSHSPEGAAREASEGR